MAGQHSRRGLKNAWIGLGLLLCAGTWPALAQLTPDDIEALRKQGEAEGWTFTVGLNDATQYPLAQLCGSVEPPDWRAHARFDPGGERRDLPPAWDWRQHNGTTPIRNQGGCGSCWAHAAIGATECQMLIRTGLSLNLSEQWLVSCTSSGNCAGGWPMAAYEFLRCNGLTDPCGGNGAVLEADFPYTGTNAPCNCPYPHPYCLDYWMAIGDPRWSNPTVTQIKQAIYDHGPVSASVYAGSAFQAYSGGVFNACTNQVVNHDIVLVGWDDNQGPAGVWILRNSWGTGWGESGYMRITYGCCNVGYAAAYVDYSAPDCNGNGVRDATDIAAGTSLDCNRNGIPDECDLASGRSADCNGNGIPDECDVALPLPELVSNVAPVLGWMEISGTGTPLNLGFNQAVEVPLPFVNELVRVGPVDVCNDGVIGFCGPLWVPDTNMKMPTGALFGGMVALAPLWDLLDRQTGNVYWQTSGTTPNRTFIVEWYNRPHYPGDYVLDGDEVTFQVQLYETPVQDVLAQFLYLDTDFQNSAYNNGASATIGFQLDGARGRQWSFNQANAINPSIVLSIRGLGQPDSPDVNHDGIPDECQGVKGDLNCDGAVNFADIDPFVLALSDRYGYTVEYPNCQWLNADCNRDGRVDFADIDPFVALLGG